MHRARVAVPGARKGCRPAAVPVLALPSPGVVTAGGRRAHAGAHAGRGYAAWAMAEGGADGSEPGGGHTAFCGMSCGGKVLMRDGCFVGETPKRLMRAVLQRWRARVCETDWLLPLRLRVPLRSGGSSDLRFLKPETNAVTLRLCCSLQTPSVQCAAVSSDSGSAVRWCCRGTGGSSRICPPIDASLLPGPRSAPRERALSCTLLQPLLKFERRAVCQGTFLLSRDFLALPHAGFVKLCSW